MKDVLELLHRATDLLEAGVGLAWEQTPAGALRGLVPDGVRLYTGQRGPHGPKPSSYDYYLVMPPAWRPRATEEGHWIRNPRQGHWWKTGNAATKSAALRLGLSALLEHTPGMIPMRECAHRENLCEGEGGRTCLDCGAVWSN